jgi:hypothetical protein
MCVSAAKRTAPFPHFPLQNIKEQARERFHNATITQFNGNANKKLKICFFVIFHFDFIFFLP